MNNYVVSKALIHLKQEPDITLKWDDEIHELFLSYLTAQDVELFNPENIAEYVKLQRSTEAFEIKVNYHQIVPLMGNLSLRIDFEHTMAMP